MKTPWMMDLPLKYRKKRRICKKSILARTLVIGVDESL
jgi:hypothetical protein